MEWMNQSLDTMKNSMLSCCIHKYFQLLHRIHAISSSEVSLVENVKDYPKNSLKKNVIICTLFLKKKAINRVALLI
jgi:hypothetical protein